MRETKKLLARWARSTSWEFREREVM